MTSNRSFIPVFTALVFGAGALFNSAAAQDAAQDVKEEEQWRKTLRESGHGDLLDEYDNNLFDQSFLLGRGQVDPRALSTRPLTVSKGFTKEVNGYWTDLGPGTPLSNGAIASQTFAQQILLNLSLYLSSRTNSSGRSFCGRTPHEVSEVSVDAIQATSSATSQLQAAAASIKVYHRVRYGQPLSPNSLNCQGQVELKTVEIVRDVSGAWYVPDWALFLRDVDLSATR